MLNCMSIPGDLRCAYVSVDIKCQLSHLAILRSLSLSLLLRPTCCWRRPTGTSWTRGLPLYKFCLFCCLESFKQNNQQKLGAVLLTYFARSFSDNGLYVENPGACSGGELLFSLSWWQWVSSESIAIFESES